MSCTLRIELDSPTVRGGAQVTGAVLVEVHDTTRSQGVHLDLAWRAEGDGDADEGPRTSVLLQGPRVWQRGDEVRLPFSLQVPGFPVTIRGEEVVVRWLLTARANVPWRGDPTAEREVEVLPGVPTEAHLSDLRLESVTQARETRLTCGACGALALAAGLLLLAATDAPGFLAFVLAAAGAGSAAWGLRNLVAERKLGTVELTVTDRVCPGDAVEVVLTLHPPHSVVLNDARAVLKCVERSVRGDTKDRRSEREHVWQVVLHEGGYLLGGRAHRLVGHIPVPAEALPSFKAPHNTIQWTLEVRVDIPEWPDWVLDTGIAVVPDWEQRVKLQRPPARIVVQPAQRCPYCRDHLAGEAQHRLVSCDGCRTVYHAECHDELGGCATRGCAHRSRGRRRA